MFDEWYISRPDIQAPPSSSSSLSGVVHASPAHLSHEDQSCLSKLTLMKQAIAKEFSQSVKIKIPYAIECLDQNNWRVMDAQEAVRILKVRTL